MNSIRAHVFAQRALRIVSLVLALTGVSIPAAVLSQTPTVTDVRQFDVPAGPLPEALTAFAAQAGISLSFDPTPLADMSSDGLRGEHTLKDGFSRLLAGTGYDYIPVSDREYTLKTTEKVGANEPARLGPITVTGARTAKSVSELAASVTVLDEEDLAKQPALRISPLDGLKRLVPGIQFNDPAGFDPRFRGRFASYRVNGVDLRGRGLIARTDLQDLAGGAFGGIEALRGADATFGQGVSGGAINFLTTRPTAGPRALESSVFLSFDPDGHGRDQLTRGVRQSVTGSSGNTDYYVGGGFMSYGSEFDPQGDPLPDDTGVTKRNADELDLNATLVFNLSPDQSIETSHYFVHNTKSANEYQTIFDGQGAFGDKSTVMDNPRKVDTGGDRNLYVGTAEYRDADFHGHALSLKLFGTLFDADTFQGSRIQENHGKIGLNTTLATPLASLPGTFFERALIEWGADYEYFYGESLTFNGLPLGAGLRLHNLSPFAQLRMPLGEHYLLAAGGRYEQFYATLEDERGRAFGRPDFQGGDLDYGTALFNASLIYFASDEIELYGAFSQALDVLPLQAAAGQVASAGEIEPEPATTDQIELGLRGYWPRLEGTVAAFYSNSDNSSSFTVVSAPTPSGVIAIPLREPRRIWGIEATLDWEASEHLKFGGYLAWADGERENDHGDWVELPQSSITPLTLAPYIEYVPDGSWLFRLQAVHTTGTGARTEIFNNVDGFSTNARTFIDFLARHTRPWGEISLGVENLFNEFAFSDLAEARNFNRSIPFQGRRVSLQYNVDW